MEHHHADLSIKSQQVGQLRALTSAPLAEFERAADVALHHSSQWDLIKDGTLTMDELINVYAPSVLDMSQRRSAGLLAQNFNDACLLNAPTKSNQPEGLSWAGSEYFKSVFASDSNYGITAKDLTTLKMLSSEAGHQSFIRGAQNYENTWRLGTGMLTGVCGTFAVMNLASILGGKGNLIKDIALGASVLATFVIGSRFMNGLTTNDFPEMEAQFKRRQDMLARWKSSPV